MNKKNNILDYFDIDFEEDDDDDDYDFECEFKNDDEYYEAVNKMIEERKDGEMISFDELLDFIDELTEGRVNTDKFRTRKKFQK